MWRWCHFGRKLSWQQALLRLAFFQAQCSRAVMRTGRLLCPVTFFSFISFFIHARCPSIRKNFILISRCSFNPHRFYRRTILRDNVVLSSRSYLIPLHLETSISFPFKIARLNTDARSSRRSVTMQRTSLALCRVHLRTLCNFSLARGERVRG